MAKPLPAPFDKQKVVAENRRARFDYFVEERFEAGIQLAGTEVKSLRHGEGSRPHEARRRLRAVNHRRGGRVPEHSAVQHQQRPLSP